MRPGWTIEERHLLRALSRRDLLGNTLVLIAPADSRVRLESAAGGRIFARYGFTAPGAAGTVRGE